MEVACEIIAVADDVTQWQVGDKICALVPGGGYAELVNTYAAHCLPLPTGYSYVQAAALPETFFTVWGNLFIREGLKAGEAVLIHGGSGGIGTTAIQMASRLGAKLGLSWLSSRSKHPKQDVEVMEAFKKFPLVNDRSHTCLCAFYLTTSVI
ncbi:hypothetical protein GCM10011607_38080 [Shewanella inventionis]|uniref:Enoyl reductase (ER) domain-containing protein n=1 Tax=Shewanella inventionis TaxID=1738770 RepID=A0ABQ1JSS4_9GAMM|nr:hypothetical protein GCM10011607_38080 [Shewanella inventionis]